MLEANKLVSSFAEKDLWDLVHSELDMVSKAALGPTRPMGNRVETYRELGRVLQEDGNHLERDLIRQLTTLASRDMRVGQGVADELQRAASDILVSLARSHFLHIMDELQSHLRPGQETPEEFVFITLSKLATSYVLETWSKGVTLYFRAWAKCSFPRIGEARLCDKTYPLFCSVVRNWLDCEEEELKQAIIRAVAAMMGLLLHKEEYEEQVCSRLSWLLGQYEEVQDSAHVTKSLSHFLEVVVKSQLLIPKGIVFVICIVVHSQLSNGTKGHSTEHKTELSYCMLLLARRFPDDTMQFLYSQLQIENEACRATSLYLLRSLLRCDCKQHQEESVSNAVGSTAH
nr:PREDICTED: maestro heat-like repeat-containing protein family member 2B [Struthio camelus australis]